MAGPAFASQPLPERLRLRDLLIRRLRGWFQERDFVEVDTPQRVRCPGVDVHVDALPEVGRTFERATGQAPFQQPDTWLSKQGSIDGSTPYDFSTTLDIIGGNSGSPVVDARGDIVGLAFDGNIHSISGDYWYDPVMNRTVSVDVRAIRLALDRIYGARALLEEMDAAR